MEYFNNINFLDIEIISTQGDPDCFGYRSEINMLTYSPLILINKYMRELLMNQNMLTTLITLY